MISEWRSCNQTWLINNYPPRKTRYEIIIEFNTVTINKYKRCYFTNNNVSLVHKNSSISFSSYFYTQIFAWIARAEKQR